MARAPSRTPGRFKSALGNGWKRLMMFLAPDAGRRGENLAARFMRRQGYKIAARNFRVRGGEADLVAEKGGQIVVVEVKTRSSRQFGTPAEGITRTKARRVRIAAAAYCRQKGISLSRLRIDVIAVEIGAEGADVRHYPSAIGWEG